MLNEQLKLIRKYNGFTQQQIADILKIDRSTYASYETGRNRPDISYLQKFSNIFGVSVDYILHLDEKNIYRLRDETDEYEKQSKSDSLVSHLTADEKVLLGVYRQCDEDMKQKILAGVKKNGKVFFEK